MPWARPLPHLELCGFDLEATGAAPGYDRIIEVAAARFRLYSNGCLIPGPTLRTLVDPGRPISAQTVALTGIDDALVRGAPDFATAWPELERFLGQADVVVGHGVSSDLHFLVAETARIGAAWNVPPAVCTYEIARRIFQDAPSYRLSALVRWLGAAEEGATYHRALPDALHTRNLLGRAVAALGKPVGSLRELGVKRPVPVPRPHEVEVRVPEALAWLESAAREGGEVRVVYRGGSKGRSERALTPLGFFAKDSVLFLRAWCHLDEATKSFRCDRISRGAGADKG
jgi:DNA polymerase III epsilon subunit-like protein